MAASPSPLGLVGRMLPRPAPRLRDRTVRDLCGSATALASPRLVKGATPLATEATGVVALAAPSAFQGIRSGYRRDVPVGVDHGADKTAAGVRQGHSARFEDMP